MVIDNHNLIYLFLHRYNLSIDEYYDVAAIGLCKAAINYDKKKSKFSTFAVTAIRNEVFMDMRLGNSLKRIPKYKIAYYQDKPNPSNEDNDGLELLDLIKSSENTEDEAISMVMLRNYEDKLNSRNKEIVKLASRGYKQREIAKILNLSQAQVSRILKGMKKYITDG